MVRELYPDAVSVFKDSYLVEFLDLPKGHSEADLHRGWLKSSSSSSSNSAGTSVSSAANTGCQVGGRDFFLDLLFFNRALNALVDFELKIGEFQPEHLGKLEFCLEALDRDVRKPHERPSIGVLLCATKDHEVVEYALSRAMSPALVAEYKTRMPDKNLLQAKLHEFYQLAESEAVAAAAVARPGPPLAQLPPPKKKLRRAATKQPKKTEN